MTKTEVLPIFSGRNCCLFDVAEGNERSNEHSLKTKRFLTDESVIVGRNLHLEQFPEKLKAYTANKSRETATFKCALPEETSLEYALEDRPIRSECLATSCDDNHSRSRYQVLVPELQKRRIRFGRQNFLRRYAVGHVHKLAGERRLEKAAGSESQTDVERYKEGIRFERGRLRAVCSELHRSLETSFRKR